MWVIFAPLIRIRIPDPDPLNRLNPDPIRIRIRNPGLRETDHWIEHLEAGDGIPLRRTRAKMLDLMRRHGEGRQETHEELVHWFPVGILSRERYPSRWGM